MNRIFFKKHLTTLSILLFISLFSILQVLKPAFLYNQDGSLRTFGLRKNKSTIIPLWAATCALAIFSYLFILRLTN